MAKKNDGAPTQQRQRGRQNLTPLGLTQPILAGVVAIGLGVASSTTPEMFKIPIFAMSMVVTLLAGWLLVRSQWPAVNAFHLRFAKAIYILFSTLSAVAIVSALVVALNREASEPMKFDSADYALREQFQLATNRIADLESTNTSLRAEVDAQREQFRAATNELAQARAKINSMDPRLGIVSSLSMTLEAVFKSDQTHNDRFIASVVCALGENRSPLITATANEYHRSTLPEGRLTGC